MGSKDIECKGCSCHINSNNFHPEKTVCSLPWSAGKINCPCLECLVKGICNNDNAHKCKMLQSYIDHLNDSKHENKRGGMFL